MQIFEYTLLDSLPTILNRLLDAFQTTIKIAETTTNFFFEKKNTKGETQTNGVASKCGIGILI